MAKPRSKRLSDYSDVSIRGTDKRLSDYSALEMQSLTLNELAGALVGSKNLGGPDSPQPEIDAQNAKQRPLTLPGHISRRKLAQIKSDTAASLSGFNNIKAPKMPRTWGECQTILGATDPCPFVRCRHHLAADVMPQWSPSRDPAVKVNFPQLETAIDLPETCSLRAASLNPDGMTLEQVAELMNITRERIRQIEEGAMDKARQHMIPFAPDGSYDDHHDDSDTWH